MHLASAKGGIRLSRVCAQPLSTFPVSYCGPQSCNYSQAASFDAICALACGPAMLPDVHCPPAGPSVTSVDTLQLMPTKLAPAALLCAEASPATAAFMPNKDHILERFLCSAHPHSEPMSMVLLPACHARSSPTTVRAEFDCLLPGRLFSPELALHLMP